MASCGTECFLNVIYCKKKGEKILPSANCLYLEKSRNGNGCVGTASHKTYPFPITDCIDLHVCASLFEYWLFACLLACSMELIFLGQGYVFISFFRTPDKRG